MFDHYIQRKLRPTIAFVWTYVATLTLYLIAPVLSWFHHRRDLLFNMMYPFDHTPLHLYVPLLGSNVWIAVIATTLVVGEAYLLTTVMLHLSGRYLLLAEDLQRSSQQLLSSPDADRSRDDIAQQLGAEIKCMTARSVKLNEFGAELQQFFSYRVFITFFFAATILCALCFKVYTNVVGSISSIFWIISKSVKLLVIGAVGSHLIATTDDVSSMFYLHSNWEEIVSLSSNTRANVRLMKLLCVAIETSRKPFVLTGLSFVSVSLTAVLKILEGAASYFTCLISFR